MSNQLGFNSNYYQGVINNSKPAGKILARVDKVILGPVDINGNRDDDFYNNGLWASVGSIRYTLMYSSNAKESDPTSNNIAKPYNPNSVIFPKAKEIVELVDGPSDRLNEDSQARTLYYVQPINLWNTVHHNSFPDFFFLSEKTKSKQQVPYIDNKKGITVGQTTGSSVLDFGDEFPEKTNISNLQPFPGDIIRQGRWGQSIRFGSTVKSTGILNPWSSIGNNGDPIIIIRNGQPAKTGVDPWVTIVEDINNDAASVYLCSGQLVMIEDLKNFKLDSFAVGVKLEQTNVQEVARPPISTDATSPASQSAYELKHAQLSEQSTLPSTVPQTQTTVTVTPVPAATPPPRGSVPTTPGNFYVYGPQGEILRELNNKGEVVREFVQNLNPVIQQPQPAGALTPTQSVQPVSTAYGFISPLQPPYTASQINIVTSIFNPGGGTPTTNTVVVPYTPNTGTPVSQIVNQVMNNPGGMTQPVTQSVSPSGSANTKQNTLPSGLEQITAEEDLFRYNNEFTIDVAENIQDDVPETKSPSEEPRIPSPADKNSGTKVGSTVGLIQNDGTLGSAVYYPCALFNQGDPSWGSKSDGTYTLKQAGCCYNSVCMIITHHTKDGKYTPLYMWDNISKSVVVYWNSLTGAAKLSGTKKSTNSISDVDTILKTKPLAFEWDNTNRAKNTKYAGQFTKRHHWMVINGKNSDGTYTVFDPNGGRIWRNQSADVITAGLINIFYIT